MALSNHRERAPHQLFRIAEIYRGKIQFLQAHHDFGTQQFHPDLLNQFGECLIVRFDVFYFQTCRSQIRSIQTLRFGYAKMAEPGSIPRVSSIQFCHEASAICPCVAEYSRSALRLGENPQTKLLSAQTPALESFLALVSVADAVAFPLERPADCNPRCSETACGSLDQPESFLPRTHS